MLVQHYGSLIVSLALIAFSIVASYYVWQSPRDYGSPRWPQLLFFGSIALRGIAYFLLSIHRPSGYVITETISTGVLWLAVGAVLTQWFHESVQQRRPMGR